MADQQRCEKCGGDQLATVLKDSKALCNACAGLPSVMDRFQQLTDQQQGRLQEMFRGRRGVMQAAQAAKGA